MRSFRTPTRFQFLNEKLYFCPYFAESANIAGNGPFIRCTKLIDFQSNKLPDIKEQSFYAVKTKLIV
jgi:hypothetical protein